MVGQYFRPTKMVEVTGLEPTTSWSRTKRATKLRYTSLNSARLWAHIACRVNLYIIFFRKKNVKRNCAGA